MKSFDGDGHFVEPAELWDEYVPTTMRDRVFMTRDENGYADRLVMGDVVIRHQSPVDLPIGMGDWLTPGGIKPGRPKGLRYEESAPGGWNAVERLAIYDAEDIVGGVLFPTRGLLCGAITDPEIALTACRAINDWAADYVSAAPDELYVAATLSDHFPDLAAQELRRCVERHGFVTGFVLPNPTVDGRCLDHPDFEPLWATAVDLGVPICAHSTRQGRPTLGEDRNLNWMTQHATAFVLEAMMAFVNLYQGGVFERHPALHIGFMEATCGWVPFWIERLHEHFEVAGWLVDAKSDPRDVFREHCVVGCEGEEEMVPYVQERFGTNSVLWASDYPHYDVDPPFAEDMLSRTDMSAAQLDGVMHEAAVAFYHLDWDRILRANARRRGLPRVA